MALFVSGGGSFGGGGGGGGGIEVGTIDSVSPSSNGAVISASVLYMQSASDSVPGLLNLSAQDIVGVKTFLSAPQFSSLTASQALALDSSKNVITIPYASSNVASSFVARDSSGNFSAGTITASLTGHASLDVATSSLGNLTDVGTDGITITGGTGAVVGSVSIAQHVADSTHSGYLSSADWGTFNSKQSALTFGNITDSSSGADGISISGGTGAIIGSGVSISQHVADSTHSGYLSSADWNTFHSAAAGGITALTGDVSATGPGSVAATLATVNSNIGSFGSASQSANFTVNAKGLITAAGSASIQITESQVTNLTTDLAAKVATSSLGNLTDVGTDGITITGGTGAVVGSVSIAQHVADSTHSGYLSSADWGTFNSKQSALTFGNISDVGTDGIAITGGTNAIIGSGVTIAQHVADTTHNGYLSSSDWNTFNSKQSALTIGNISDVGTDGITITGGSNAIIGSGVTIAQHVADSTHNGYLSSSDWSTFNGKQASGNYITALTGDVSASGPGSAAATLASVNSNVGSFGSSTAIPSFTVNAKGLITAASTNAVVAPAGTLTGTTLASGVITSSLTSVGTISTGTWQATPVGISYGGTGTTTGTGSGSVVLSNSPTLVTPALGTPASGVLTNCSGTASSLTAGKATAPASGSAHGAVTLDSSGNFKSVSGASSGDVLTFNGADWVSGTPTSSGTVTSVTFTGDGTVLSSTPSSAVTVSGTVSASLNTQAANKILAGPTTGSPASPTFRSLVAADLPTQGYLPSGMMAPYAGSSAPTGWLLCDGSAVSRTTYAALFSAIGTTYGSGDGTTTFNIPNTQGVFLRGAGSQTIGGRSFSGTLGASHKDSTAVNGLTNSSSAVSGTSPIGVSTSGTNNNLWHDNTSTLAGGDGSTAGNYGVVGSYFTAAAQSISGDAETAPGNLGVNYIIKT